MRLTLAFIFACSFVGHTLLAQISIGPELGIGVSNMRFDPPAGIVTSISNKAILSGRAGGNIDLSTSKHLYLQSGVFVSQKGHIRNYKVFVNDSFNATVERKLYIHYLDVPVNVVFKTGFEGRTRFIAGMGATFSYIIGGRDKVTGGGVYEGRPYTLDNNDRLVADKTLAGFDLGINFITGCELPNGILLKAYYTIGWNDIGKGIEGDKNRMGGISLGYFPGKGRKINKEADDLIDKGH